jgi:hypothetical protein
MRRDREGVKDEEGSGREGDVFVGREEYGRRNSAGEASYARQGGRGKGGDAEEQRILNRTHDRPLGVSPR